MLKVVGASWFKTRVSSYILACALLLAFGSFFIADMERPQFNGTYCATSYWSKKSGFRVEFWGQRNDLEMVPKGGARACYKDSILENGWSQFEIETQQGYPDRIQAFAAGILEGALTWKSIYLQWTNTIEAECEQDEDSRDFCTWLRNVISKNVETVKDIAEVNGKHSHYWYQIKLFYDQLDGLEFGWRKGVRRSRSGLEIPPEDFLLLNSAVDIRDLKVYYKNFVNNATQIDLDQNKGQILLKILENNGFVKILLGHTSDGSYSSMLRMLKKYTFHYHFSAEQHKTNLIPGTNIIFTGYPGVIASLDDFYVVSGRSHKLIVTGVKIQNENMKLWEDIDLEKSVFLAARLMASNRLAHNGRAWAKYFARSPSTGAKQWLIVDSKHLNHANLEEANALSAEDVYDEKKMVTRKYEDYIDVDFAEFNKKMAILNKISDGGLFWVVDQLPGRLHAEDVTQDFIRNGYWRGDGVPYFKPIQNISLVKPSNHSIEKYLKNITNLDALAKFLRKQGYRGDLDKENPDAFGNIDMKLFSETNMDSVEFQAYSGPMYEQTPEIQFKRSADVIKPSDNSAINIDLKKTKPFSWTLAEEKFGDEEFKHEGQPEVWNFHRISPKWAWI